MLKNYIFVLIITISLLTGGLVTAQEASSQDRDMLFEQEIYERLVQIAPEAVPLFQFATQAYDSNDLETARANFEAVLGLAPEFPDALRRLGYVELDLGNYSAAEAITRRAMEVDDSAYNRAALAAILLATDNPAQNQEALSLARSAARQLPDDNFANVQLLLAGVATSDIDALRQGAEAIVRLRPDEPIGHLGLGLAAAETGHWQVAQTELNLARDLGWPAEDIQEILDSKPADRAGFGNVLRIGLGIGVLWAIILLVLFLLGIFLSRATLATINRTQATATYHPSANEKWVRRIYQVVINLSVVYFYLSMPILIMIVLGVAGGVLYLFYQIGRIPGKVLGGLFFLVVATVFAILKGMFTRVQLGDPGRRLLEKEAPQLWSMTREVAKKVNTRPVDEIFIVPGPEIAVTERGSILKRLVGQSQRYLILGLGALEDMTQIQLKAILAHEYGHFSNRDTAGGNLAFQVRNAMGQMADHLAINQQAHELNPLWIYINIFNSVFLRMTLGASRLREVLADRYAALAYGSQNFMVCPVKPTRFNGGI